MNQNQQYLNSTQQQNSPFFQFNQIQKINFDSQNYNPSTPQFQMIPNSDTLFQPQINQIPFPKQIIEQQKPKSFIQFSLVNSMQMQQIPMQIEKAQQPIQFDDTDSVKQIDENEVKFRNINKKMDQNKYELAYLKMESGQQNKFDVNSKENENLKQSSSLKQNNLSPPLTGTKQIILSNSNEKQKIIINSELEDYIQFDRQESKLYSKFLMLLAQTEKDQNYSIDYHNCLQKISQCFYHPTILNVEESSYMYSKLNNNEQHQINCFIDYFNSYHRCLYEKKQDFYNIIAKLKNQNIFQNQSQEQMKVLYEHIQDLPLNQWETAILHFTNYQI